MDYRTVEDNRTLGVRIVAVDDNIDAANAIDLVFVNAVNEVGHAGFFKKSRDGIDAGKQPPQLPVAVFDVGDVLAEETHVEGFAFGQFQILAEFFATEDVVAEKLDVANFVAGAFGDNVLECGSRAVFIEYDVVINLDVEVAQVVVILTQGGNVIGDCVRFVQTADVPENGRFGLRIVLVQNR